MMKMMKMMGFFAVRHHADEEHDTVDLLRHLVDELGLLFGTARGIECPCAQHGWTATRD